MRSKSTIEWLKDEIQDHIANSGFSIITLDRFSYTVGLYQSYKHPEICILGLDQDTALKILYTLGAKIREDGQVYVVGRTYDQIILNYLIGFRRVERDKQDEWFEAANEALYINSFFSSIQCLFPDEKGALPSSTDCDPKVVAAQTWDGLRGFVNFVRGGN